MSLKNVTLIDPLGELPPLVITPDEEGYSRSIVNLRKSSGRTAYGATKIEGNRGDYYFTWQIGVNLAKEESANLLQVFVDTFNNRLLPGSRAAGFPQYLLLDDNFLKVPPVKEDSTRYNLNIASSQVLLYPSGNYKTGFAQFKCILNLSDEYISYRGNCRYKLNFGVEEVK